MLKLRFSRDKKKKPAKQSQYIFIIGFNKTGTRSLHQMFEDAGFASIHNGIKRDKLAVAMVKNLLEGRKLLHGFDHKFTVFSDISHTTRDYDIQAQTYFPMLDRDYPGSLFIMNKRPVDNWVKSRMNHKLHGNNALLDNYRSIYRTDDLKLIKSLWVGEYEEHLRRVREYFGDSPSYLEIDIEADDIPAALTTFVGHEFKSSDWLHVGKTKPSDKAIGHI